MLGLENHYKDGFWTYPEFAQRSDLFCALVDRVDRSGFSNFGVNFDPSNALLAGEDPVALRQALRNHRVELSISEVDMTRLDLAPRGIDRLLRASVHATTTEEELDRFVSLLLEIR